MFLLTYSKFAMDFINERKENEKEKENMK